MSLFIESTLIELDFLKNIVRIANPIAASAAATTKINKEKNLSRQISKNIRESNKIYVCREKHQFNRHKNSNKIFPIYKIPKKPIEKTNDERTRK